LSKHIDLLINEETHAILKEKAKELGVPMAFIVKSAIRSYLKMKGWKK